LIVLAVLHGEEGWDGESFMMFACCVFEVSSGAGIMLMEEGWAFGSLCMGVTHGGQAAAFFVVVHAKQI
jgi:hypothetical protein